MIGNVVEFNGVPMVNKTSLTRVPIRLGMDVFSKGEISREKQDLLIRTLYAYKKLLKVYDPQEVMACGTAAMREASNAAEVCERVYFETGLKLRIISGKEEAMLISSSSNTLVNKPYDYSLYVDVGGGSTELSYFKQDTLIATRSFNIGAIRMLIDTDSKAEWDAMRNWLEEQLEDGLQVNCICSGGNINKLTKMFGNQEKFTLTYAQLVDCLMYLEGYPVEDRMKKFGLREDRADVIVPAATIFKKIMKWARLQELQAPKIGLADGIIVDLYKKHNGQPTVLK